MNGPVPLLACTIQALWEDYASDQPDLILELLRRVRATRAEHAAVPARLDRRVLATRFNAIRIRRENAGDAETALSTIMDHHERVRRLGQAAREQP